MPPSDTESINEIEGYFLESKDLDPIFTELHHAGVQNTSVREILDCYVNLPDDTLVRSNPLNFKNISEEQQTDEKLKVFK